jgi:uncharacterized membrane protein
MHSTKRTFMGAAYVLVGSIMILASIGYIHRHPDYMAFQIVMGVAWVVGGLVRFRKRERLP